MILLSLVVMGAYIPSAKAQLQLPVFDEMIILAPLPLKHTVDEVKRNSSVHEALINAGVDPRVIHDIVKVSRPTYNLRHIQPGTRFVVSRELDGKIHRVTFDIGPLSRLEVKHSHQEWTAEIVEVETTKEVVHYSGTINDSLWSSGVNNGLSPEVIQTYAEVFGWQVDFAREVREGDSWKFTIEKLFAEGRAVGWGNIVYAEYTNRATTHKAYFYQNKVTGTRGYFDENGQSMRKVFLKSPIKFGRITSRFSRRRFHPIHKRYKAHNGVDYGAPRGTPIRAVGDGRVIKIGRYRGSGKMVVLDHVAGYKTKYLHMSRFKKGLRRGSRVLQGQVIGYVGATGYATGPHLHFEMHKHRRVIDPLKVNLPSSDPVPADAIAHYQEYVSKINRNIASVPKPVEEVPTTSSAAPLKTINSKMQ